MKLFSARSLSRERRKSPAAPMLAMAMLFFFTAFLLLALKDFSWQAVGMALAVPAIMLLGVTGLPKLFHADKLLLSLVNFLCALGVLVLYRLNAQKGMTQALYYLLGVGAMLFCILLVRYMRAWKWMTVLLCASSLALLALPLVFREKTNDAYNWVTLAGVRFQPSEVVKLALLLALAFLLANRKYILAILFAGACLALLMLQQDLGTALIYYGTTLFMLFAATGSLLLVGLGLAGGAGAAYFGYTRFRHVQKRVAIWQNPWNDPQGAGYQIVQSLIAMANGGLWGVGLGVGNATVIPEYDTDFIFAVILNEFGVVFGLVVLLIYLAIVIRGVGVALRARNRFDALLAIGCTALLALQTFVIIGGNIKLIPLTGVTLPFISRGGTSLISSLCLVGLLQGVASRNDDAIKKDKALAELAREELS